MPPPSGCVDALANTINVDFSSFRANKQKIEPIARIIEKNMNIKKSLPGLGLAPAMVGATSARAVSVVSMTIEEIGSTGVGPSVAGTGGGIFYSVSR